MKSGRKLDAPGIRVAQPIDDRFTAAVNYQNYRLLNKASRDDDDISQALHKVAKKILIQMKYYNFFGQDSMSVVPFF